MSIILVILAVIFWPITLALIFGGLRLAIELVKLSVVVVFGAVVLITIGVL